MRGGWIKRKRINGRVEGDIYTKEEEQERRKEEEEDKKGRDKRGNGRSSDGDLVMEVMG